MAQNAKLAAKETEERDLRNKNMDSNTGKILNDEKEIQEALDRGAELIELEAKPSPNCHKCFGRGALKSWGTPYRYGACPVCYPAHPKKAVSFKQHLKKLT